MVHGKRLKELLTGRGIRQIDFAKSLNVHEQTVSRWITSAHLSTDVIEKICSALSMEPWEFFMTDEARATISGLPAELMQLSKELKELPADDRKTVIDTASALIQSLKKNRS